MDDAKKIFIEDNDLSWEVTGIGVRRKIIAYDKNLMMVKVQFDKGAVGVLHKHPHLQMTYVESGRFEMQVEKEKVILKAGDASYIPSNTLHGVVCLEAGSLLDVFNPAREDFFKS